MRVAHKEVKNLLNYYREISLLNKVGALLGWDLEVNLPPKASETRALQNAYVTKLVSSKWLEADFRKSLEKASSLENLNLYEKAVVRNLNQAAKFYHRVPQEIIVEFSETTSKAFFAWREARLQNRYKIFEAHLKKIISLNQIIAGHIGYADNPYDALLDIYEPGFSTKEGKQIFDSLINQLALLIKRIKKSREFLASYPQEAVEYPEASQRQIANYVLRKMGYDFNAGRMDISAHPFTTQLGVGDTRITNRYSPDNFIESIMVAMHEGGHALYEQGVSAEFDNTPLEGGVSLGIHESQSRFWENQIGRSLEFCKYLEPVLKAFYPVQLSKYDSWGLYKAFNRVKPSFIRTEADEVTYNLHIALRFELEEALINERVSTRQLPEVWRDKMEKYLGVVPKTDSEGVLQDVHWSHGSFGYFPTYTLGNLYAAQFSYFMASDLDVKGLVRDGEFATILSWLREGIHKHGGLYWPKELVERVTGKPLSADYFLNYLTKKYSEIYSL